MYVLERLPFITHADSRRRGRVFTDVCLFIHTISQKTAAARITKLDVEVFHNESWKSIYFGVKGRGQESQNHCGVCFDLFECLFLLVLYGSNVVSVTECEVIVNVR